jgi:hypothetical protein
LIRRFGGMSEQVEICRTRAEECERAAVVATKASVRANYANLANQWREMAEQAEQAEELEERRLAVLRRLSSLSISPRISGAATSIMP